MPLDYEKLMRMPIESARQTYTRRDTMLYALGLGVGTQDPCDWNELKYVYEKDLVALPTMAVTLAAGAMRLADPSFGVNYRMLLHAEQSLVMHKPLPVEGTVVSQGKIDEIYDKGAAKGAIMYSTRTLHDEATGDLLVTMSTVSFLRADGGFGGKSQGAPKPRPVPLDRPADLTAPLPVFLNQALIYPARPVRLRHGGAGIAESARRRRSNPVQASRRAVHEPRLSGRAAAHRNLESRTGRCVLPRHRDAAERGGRGFWAI